MNFATLYLYGCYIFPQLLCTKFSPKKNVITKIIQVFFVFFVFWMYRIIFKKKFVLCKYF